MRIAWHEYPLILLTFRLQFVEEDFHAVGNLHQLMACKQFQVDQYLVVTGASRVNLFSYIPQFAGEHQLHLRVDILHSLLDAELPLLAYRIDILQLRQQLLQLVSLQQPDSLQHGDMSHRAQYVIRSQVEVHLPVTSHGEALDLRIHLKILLPKFVHNCCYYDYSTYRSYSGYS